MKLLGLMILGACIAAPGMAKAQEEILTTEPAGTSSWRSLSRTNSYIYLADVGAISDEGGVKSVRMARAPRTPASATDREHTVETYQFQCGPNQWRVTRTVEIGPDGAELDAWDEPDSAWLAVPPDTNMAFLKLVACDGEVPTGRAWPRLTDFLASPRT